MDAEITVALIGISHKTAPIEIREKIALSALEQEFVLRTLVNDFKLQGSLVVSTCNRTEVYISCNQCDEVLPKVRNWLNDYKKCDYFNDDRLCYTMKARDAVGHFMKVVSSLDSQVIGEPQITGQIKDAHYLSRKLKTTNMFLNKMFDIGIQAQKQIRSKTFLTDGAVSISFAAVELAKKIFNELIDKSVLLIGAGNTAELAAKHFVEKGVQNITIVNRTPEKAAELAGRFCGKVFEFDRLPEVLEKTDIVISATSSKDHVLNSDLMINISKARHHKPLFLIDLAVPRDIDPEIDKIDGAFLYNVDDLNEVVQMNLEKRNQEIPKALKIIDRFVDEFGRWISTHSDASTIMQLKQYFEEIRQNELNRLKNRLPKEGFSEIDYLTRSIVNKLMHQHIKTLKNSVSNPVQHQQQIEFMHKIYDLDYD